MSEFASEETIAAVDELETPVEHESSVDDGPSDADASDEDWGD
jgi:hypothetical protein